MIQSLRYTKAAAIGAVLMTSSLFPLSASAEFQDGDYFFEPISDTAVAFIADPENVGSYRGNVVIPEKASDGEKEYDVTRIATFAFDFCTGLRSVTIPQSVTTIEEMAFSYCTSLKTVTIPASVTKLGTILFYGSTSMTAINVDEANPYYCSIDGVLYDKSITRLLECPETITEIDIPASVEVIGYGACFNCGRLSRVTIPSSVYEIEPGAFQMCASLKEITVPSSVEKIGSWAFGDCANLKNVNLNEGLLSVGSATFELCNSLEEISFPNSFERLGEQAFNGCLNLREVTLGTGLNYVDRYAFSDCINLESLTVKATEVPDTDFDAFTEEQYLYTTLYVPADSMAEYSLTDPWSQFKNMDIYMPSGVTPAVAHSNLAEITVTEGTLTVTTAPATAITVYDANGHTVAHGTSTLSITATPGIYMVKTGNTTRKVML